MLGTSWRAFGTDVWNDHDAVILSDGGPSGRKSYEVYVHGDLIANRPSLADAKAAVESKYGVQAWRVVRMDPITVEHYYFGESTEWTAPTTVWVVDTL